MSEDIKELVGRLRTFRHRDANAAADALEAMAEQRDRFINRFYEVHLALKAAEAERDRLKAALEKIEATRPHERTLDELRQIARKALGGDAS